MPPNSHGEANPADKDPVPPPFDNTYNSPEHDAFVIKVKYQRTDDFFTEEHGRRRRPRARWSTPGTTCSGRGRTTTPTSACCSITTSVTLASRADRGHDAGADRGAARPRSGRTCRSCARTTTTSRGDDAGRARPRRRRARLREPRLAASADAPARQASLRAFYRTSRTTGKLSITTAPSAPAGRARADVAGVPLPRRDRRRAAPRRTLNDWELASRLSFFLWSSMPDDELRRAAAAGELRDPDEAGERRSRA